MTKNLNRKLTQAQLDALSKIDDQWKCAEDVGATMQTMDALYARRLVCRRSELGKYSLPRKGIFFKRRDHNMDLKSS